MIGAWLEAEVEEAGQLWSCGSDVESKVERF